MSGFNAIYYSFAGDIAQAKRDNSVFKETVKLFTTPMIMTLTIMTLADENSEFGNAILGGKEPVVCVKDADFISGGIYKDNLPVQIDFEMGKSIQFKLAKRKRGIFGWRTVPLKRGTYTLEIRAYVSGRGQGWDDEFYIL